MIALQVYGLGFAISICIAMVIRGLSLMIDKLPGEANKQNGGGQ